MSACTQVILASRPDILSVFGAGGWDVSCANHDAIVAHWCSGRVSLEAVLDCARERSKHGECSSGPRRERYLFGVGIMFSKWLDSLAPEEKAVWDGRNYDRIVDMGGDSTHVDLPWAAMQAAHDDPIDWTYADKHIAEAIARGLEPFAYTGTTPAWALPTGKTEVHRNPPDDAYQSDFIEFHTELSQHFCGAIRYYSFWNEQNGCSWIRDGCSNGDDAMVAEYVKWLNLWAQAMRAGCSDVVLSLGGLDCNGSNTYCDEYLDRIYSAGGGDSFDAVSLHPYGQAVDGKMIGGVGLNWNDVDAVLANLAARGHASRKVWIDEWGWNTADEALKSRLITRVLEKLEEPAYANVFQARYLTLTDVNLGDPSPHDYGLCEADLTTGLITPRASGEAFCEHAAGPGCAAKP